MNRNRYVIVFDYETDSGPEMLDTLNIVQVAALPIDLRNLEILTDQIFNLDVRPDEIDEPDYFDVHEKTINWHAQQQRVSPQEVFERWKNGVPEKDAWEDFHKYVKGYAKGGAWDQQPIAAGQNIRGFDMPITHRYGKKYKKPIPFARRELMDLMDLSTYWFLFSSDPPPSIGLDALRDYFGIDKIGSHDAKKDILDCANLLQRFLKIHEQISPRIRWRKEVHQEV